MCVDCMYHVADYTLYDIPKAATENYGKSLLLMLVHYSKFMNNTKKNSDILLQLQSENMLSLSVVHSSHWFIVLSSSGWLGGGGERGGARGNLWCLILALSHSAPASPSSHYIVGLITSSLKLVWITVCEKWLRIQCALIGVAYS